jgi:tetratricopeptide (TPR) repeat protein
VCLSPVAGAFLRWLLRFLVVFVALALAGSGCARDRCDAARIVSRTQGNLAAGELSRALADTDEFERRCGPLPSLWKLRYDAWVRLSDFRAAIAEATRLIERDDKDSGAWALRGKARENAAQLGEAAEDYRHAVELGPLERPETLERLVDLDIRRDQRCHAAVVFRHLMQTPNVAAAPTFQREYQRLRASLGPHDGCVE